MGSFVLGIGLVWGFVLWKSIRGEIHGTDKVGLFEIALGAGACMMAGILLGAIIAVAAGVFIPYEYETFALEEVDDGVLMYEIGDSYYLQAPELPEKSAEIEEVAKGNSKVILKPGAGRPTIKVKRLHSSFLGLFQPSPAAAFGSLQYTIKFDPSLHQIG